MNIQFMRLSDNAVTPKRATAGAAGYDLCYCGSAPAVLKPGDRALLETGIALQIPNEQCVAYIYVRSGLAINNGITLSNCVGVIDSDYRGEIKVGLVNLSNDEYTVCAGDRIAQIVFSPVILPVLCETDEIQATDRGSGGFGSTGKLKI
ncbi:MAG: dUTP diphosphatase [Oscillospiraceae bacterium]